MRPPAQKPTETTIGGSRRGMKIPIAKDNFTQIKEKEMVMLHSSIRHLVQHLVRYCLLVLVLLVVAWPARAQTNNTIYACSENKKSEDKNQGQLRRVSGPGECDPRN